MQWYFDSPYGRWASLSKGLHRGKVSSKYLGCRETLAHLLAQSWQCCWDLKATAAIWCHCHPMEESWDVAGWNCVHSSWINERWLGPRRWGRTKSLLAKGSSAHPSCPSLSKRNQLVWLKITEGDVRKQKRNCLEGFLVRRGTIKQCELRIHSCGYAAAAEPGEMLGKGEVCRAVEQSWKFTSLGAKPGAMWEWGVSSSGVISSSKPQS